MKLIIVRINARSSASTRVAWRPAPGALPASSRRGSRRPATPRARSHQNPWPDRIASPGLDLEGANGRQQPEAIRPVQGRRRERLEQDRALHDAGRVPRRAGRSSRRAASPTTSTRSTRARRGSSAPARRSRRSGRATFGEQGLLEKQERSASVIATSPLRALKIEHWEIPRMRRAMPEVLEQLQRTVEERSG